VKRRVVWVTSNGIDPVAPPPARSAWKTEGDEVFTEVGFVERRKEDLD
jgi:hypothetical protein